MNLSQLKKLLSDIEWTDVEFKEAAFELPKSAFETVSAFANTHVFSSGILVMCSAMIETCSNLGKRKSATLALLELCAELLCASRLGLACG
jgi:hypothetical protein